MDCNFACIWRRHNCRSIVIDLSLSALISWFMKSIIGFLNNSYLHAIISTSLLINLQWVKKIYFAVFGEIYNNVVHHWSALLISCSHSIISLKQRFKSEINFFCIWTLVFESMQRRVGLIQFLHVWQVVTAAGQARPGGGREEGRLTGPALQNVVHAYSTMNKFLTR